MQHIFICDTKEIEAKINTFVKIKVSNDGWSTYFTDPTNNDNWVLTFYNSNYQGGGLQVLKRLPIPATSELIEIAISSDNEDEIRCAALELLEKEKSSKNDFRFELLKRLQNFKTKDLSTFDKQRIKVIITESQLTDSTNRRDIIGKKFNEITADANYFKDISAGAKNMLIF